MGEVLGDEFLDEGVFVVGGMQAGDVCLIYLVADVAAFFGHHAVNIKSEAMLAKVCSKVLAGFLDAYGWIEFDILETGECSSCKYVSVLVAWFKGDQEDKNLPRKTPFLVKKACPVLKLTPQPMMSCDTNFGP